MLRISIYDAELWPVDEISHAINIYLIYAQQKAINYLISKLYESEKNSGGSDINSHKKISDFLHYFSFFK